ncbi:MAG: DUF1287 domain-containing protein [Peptococcaceae bacterium]|nr:DUF1287 domain-containing protein [Peptococcaceae bacterium]
MAKGKKRLAAIAVLVVGIGAAGFLHEGSFLAPKTGADFNIPTLHSAVDKDGDGIDDQADILEGVRAYIATEPRYKSKYYTTGYPDDGYGVCTDVVAQGLLAAGYDLRELVDADIHADPGAYGIDKADKNIDFRRVRNLKIYFDHTAISLTTDPDRIEEWQGGDIVVYNEHIGVVSDKRNRQGVPYLIHHASPIQRSYEENALTDREIIGHYRISQ